MATQFFSNRFRAIAAACLAGWFCAPAHADVVISATRVVYPAAEREVTVKLNNDEKIQPRLVQVWIDDGDVEKTPDQVQVPFQLTPPIFRLDAGKSQALRIAYTHENFQGKSLPTDKESLFWLNALSAPPKPAKAEGQNVLQFAIRSRIKLFFRPDGLVGQAEQAPSQLTWKVVSQGAEQAVEVHNPSAYHVSFSRIALSMDGKEIPSESPPMLAPASTARYVFKGMNHPPPAAAVVHFSIIDDFGSGRDYTARLAPSGI
jgi:chaperone protein EcpD